LNRSQKDLAAVNIEKKRIEIELQEKINLNTEVNQ
jgi:hypothetical protein